MVFSIRGRPEAAHKTLLGINNATMLTIASLPGQKILFTFLPVVQYKTVCLKFQKWYSVQEGVPRQHTKPYSG